MIRRERVRGLPRAKPRKSGIRGIANHGTVKRFVSPVAVTTVADPGDKDAIVGPGRRIAEVTIIVEAVLRPRHKIAEVDFPFVPRFCEVKQRFVSCEFIDGGEGPAGELANGLEVFVGVAGVNRIGGVGGVDVLHPFHRKPGNPNVTAGSGINKRWLFPQNVQAGNRGPTRGDC